MDKAKCDEIMLKYNRVLDNWRRASATYRQKNIGNDEFKERRNESSKKYYANHKTLIKTRRKDKLEEAIRAAQEKEKLADEMESFKKVFKQPPLTKPKRKYNKKPKPPVQTNTLDDYVQRPNRRNAAVPARYRDD